MFIIQKICDGRFVFGNKTLVNKISLARRFENRIEAEDHIDSWFDVLEYRTLEC